eukprot:g5216.t1
MDVLERKRRVVMISSFVLLVISVFLVIEYFQSFVDALDSPAVWFCRLIVLCCISAASAHGLWGAYERSASHLLHFSYMLVAILTICFVGLLFDFLEQVPWEDIVWDICVFTVLLMIQSFTRDLRKEERKGEERPNTPTNSQTREPFLTKSTSVDG